MITSYQNMTYIFRNLAFLNLSLRLSIGQISMADNAADRLFGERRKNEQIRKSPFAGSL